MKPHPRIRKAIKWGGAAVALLLVVVWIGSGWWTVEWKMGDRTFGLVPGCVFFGDRQEFAWAISDFAYSGATRSPIPRRWRWWFACETPYLARNFYVPMWAPSMLALGVCLSGWHLDALARRRERAVRLNLCPKCNYHRAGIAKDAKCPECGATPASR